MAPIFAPSPLVKIIFSAKGFYEMSYNPTPTPTFPSQPIKAMQTRISSPSSPPPHQPLKPLKLYSIALKESAVLSQF